jgi:hypothetical protein
VATDGREGKGLHFLNHLFRGLSFSNVVKIAACQAEGSQWRISLPSLVIAK